MAEQLNATPINVTNITGPGGVTGCTQSPVTGINDGYSNTPVVTATGGVSGGVAGGGGATGNNGGRLYADV